MRVDLHTPDDDGVHDAAGIAALAARFPAVELRAVDAPPPGAITAAAWRADELDFWAFDRALDAHAAHDTPVAVSAPVAVAREILTRAQRLSPRVNAHSAAPWFAGVLAAFRALHDVERPLVRADLDHALDTWQWTLRLDAATSAAVQLAALLHDVERLRTEADARVEHHAPDYQAFKDAHARAGAALAAALLARAEVPDDVARAAAALVADHERASDDRDRAAVGDADALSFFSLNSPGYLAYFGAAQTARKVAYTLARMSSRARAELPALRLPRPVRAMLAEHGVHLA